MRHIYRQIDLNQPENAPLYFPEDVVDGKENLFRLMFRLVTEGKLPAYEYLDGREVYSDKYQIDVGEMLDRFDIYYTGSNGNFTIEEADVPTNQVLTYYIIENYEFDRRSNQMKTKIEAICPVLNKIGDFGGELRYPMFWVKFDNLRPWLAQQYVFLSDDNNLAQYSLDDYFNMGMYKGDIYKYQNLRNLSMMQMYPDEDQMKLAQDSIDNRIKNYGKNLWVPTREEYLAQREAEEERARRIAEGDTLPEREDLAEATQKDTPKKSTKKRSSNKTAKAKKPASVKENNSNSSATKSVRRRKK